ncbi:MAG: hypothetical protein RLY43_2455 [Bacteroidota bacterium]|jgi:hypothetical protein
MKMEAINSKIVNIATSYVGIQELSGNKGWGNKAFQQKMELMGWGIGKAWCAYFGELVWKEAFGFTSDTAKMLDKLFSASAVSTWSNFVGNKVFKTGKLPVEGALAIWKYGTTWQGHLGIVVNSNSGIVKNGVKYFDTVEGNGNDEGGREGIEVAYKKGKSGRALDFTVKNKGLNLLGFVYPS